MTGTGTLLVSKPRPPIIACSALNATQVFKRANNHICVSEGAQVLHCMNRAVVTGAAAHLGLRLRHARERGTRGAAAAAAAAADFDVHRCHRRRSVVPAFVSDFKGGMNINNTAVSAMRRGFSSPSAATAAATDAAEAEPEVVAPVEGNSEHSTRTDGGWISLGTNSKELMLINTLPTGQSFRWRKTSEVRLPAVPPARGDADINVHIRVDMSRRLKIIPHICAWRGGGSKVDAPHHLIHPPTDPFSILCSL